MRHKVGLSIFVIGFLGVCAGIMALDSPNITVALIVIVISALISAIGYLLTDFGLVIEETGYQKITESKEIRERKARNREIVWQTWIATARGR